MLNVTYSNHYAAVKRQSAGLPRFLGNKYRDYSYLHDCNNRAHQYGTLTYFRSRHGSDPHLGNILKHFLKRDDIVLEVGCNTGNNLLPLGKRYKAYGVDLEKPLVDRLNAVAKQKGLKHRVKAAQWDMAEDGSQPPKWPRLWGKCKAIYGVHVFSHFSEQSFIDTIGKLKPYLAPGGIFIATIIDPPAADITNPQDQVFNEYHEFVRAKCPDTLAGFQSHRPEVVEQAFQGMVPVKEFSRPFYRGELKGWALPEGRIRWVVYQLPKVQGQEIKPKKVSCFSALVSGMLSRLGCLGSQSEA
jgi:SAM-dependent methyltransferase